MLIHSQSSYLNDITLRQITTKQFYYLNRIQIRQNTKKHGRINQAMPGM